MSEFEKIEKESEQNLIPIANETSNENLDDEHLGDFKMHAQEYGQKIQYAAEKAKNFVAEKLNQFGEKLNELKDKDPKEVAENVKEYARRNPGQTVLISAAVGLLLGRLLRRK